MAGCRKLRQGGAASGSQRCLGSLALFSASSMDCMLCRPVLGRGAPRSDPRERSTRP